jgi:hypothetical protein
MNWRELNEVLTDYTEQQVWDLLEDERENARRSTVIIRLHQRYTTLRMLRERAELLGEINESARSTTTGKRNHRRTRS